ncbi:nucleotide exchange factor GrpE [Aphanizomenon flos-aquae NRERC-008]|jgi:molecular chaperone GrpE (heat shock protein)/DNA-binding Xre family transcriptional regulator|uniref:Nucleotide exchange factor GrpE n=1 Tax=Aphanizomenon flos-aquae FACHB-1249 TaxID=2692889 RepID=A0ABR8IQ25_APHFL|nr:MULTISPECIES: nucleotide exchange factor GrpE [Aphanizomenon]MCE2904426.1 nucleotide exchange factor GrpE [Anabaena sp. CoA2_C59]MDJ0503945.1 nucleotide exchange factor GrpE [Nostocales cyanobacterium LE14-WE12]MBD2389420.1 nucleotide exchange factor GrpE [Aphanizomenon flos-aquae FACHB-1171]MBD2555894.1 nucleotide exchange factor GrpE [Aphanizomenon flos-aquae FACHB-1290]MBD2631977.1 nucleotide exchange factor GrpE [Aphanizomenon sp. FACHB-1399]
MPEIDFTDNLRNSMQKAGFASFKALSLAAGVSQWQILQLRRGKIAQMRVEVLVKLSQVLQVSWTELVETFGIGGLYSLNKTQSDYKNIDLLKQITDLQVEYERIKLSMGQQREVLKQEFQRSSLQILESLLLQWPTAASRAREDHQLAAVKILPLVDKPLETLLQAWDVKTIASVGDQIPYNPQFHQLLEGTAQPGEIVKVRYPGYMHYEQLLYRARVSPI